MNKHTLFSRVETIDLGSIQLVPVLSKVPMAEVHMFQAAVEHNPDIIKVFPKFAEAVGNFTAAEKLIGEYIFNFVAERRLTMLVKLINDNGNPTVGMMWLDSPDNPLVLGDYWELNFFLVKELRNQGVMSGCVQNLMTYCYRSGVYKIRALIMDNNAASARVLVKNGFIYNHIPSSDSAEVYDKILK